MSKIIKEGNLPVKQMTCNVCGCKFEFDRRDVCLSVDFEQSLIPQLAVACPYCHENHPLPENIFDQLRSQDPLKEFKEDAEALAKQYGLEIIDIKAK